MATATNMGGNKWIVLADDGRQHTVFAKADATEADAIAAIAPFTPTEAELAVRTTAFAKDECKRRIFAVVSANTQMNLAHIKDSLTGPDAAMYAAGMTWIGQMRAAWRDMAENETNPALDASWPAMPEGFAEWVSDY